MRISDWSSDVCSSDLHAAHEIDLPALEGLRQQRVVGVVQTVAGDLEGGGKGLPVLVDQQADELGKGDRRMSVVELDRDGLRQLGDIVVLRQVAAQDVGQRGGGEKVLLLQPQHLALLGRVVGIRSEEHTSELQSLMRISY